MDIDFRSPLQDICRTFMMPVQIQSEMEKPRPSFVSSGHYQTGRRQYLPLDKRMELHRLVTDLAGRGLTYRQVQNAIFSREHLLLSKGTISGWTRGIHNPSGSLNSFRQVPSPELAYVIGVVLGDGNLSIHGYNAEILLSVTDHDFAEEFSNCLAKILSREKPYKVRRSDKRNRWIVQGSSILLYRFLKKPWQNLKSWIEHCNQCTAAFLRAFYDGEGSIRGRQLGVYNTRADILIYIRGLLSRFNIGSSDLSLQKLAGTELTDPRNGRVYIRNKDCFYFRIKAKSLPLFARDVGFTINRKQQRLADALVPRPASLFSSGKSTTS